VKVLLDTDDVYAIDGKLDPKQKLVTLGNYELSDGQPVREAAAGGNDVAGAPGEAK
jgi:hypothetical protein